MNFCEPHRNFRIAAGAHEVYSTTLIIRCIERKVQYIPSLLFYKVDTMARLLMVLNASVNFLVYCAGSTAFQVGKGNTSVKDSKIQ